MSSCRTPPMGILPASLTSQSRRHARLPRVPCSQGWQPLRLHQGCQTQLSHRYASDTRNAPENCGVPRPMSICGAKNHCPFRGHLALTGSTLMCWRRCSRNAVRTVGRRKSRLDHRFSLGALQSELPPPWHVWCLNRSAPHNALISSHIFSSGGKVGSNNGSVKGRIRRAIIIPKRSCVLDYAPSLGNHQNRPRQKSRIASTIPYSRNDR